MVSLRRVLPVALPLAVLLGASVAGAARSGAVHARLVGPSQPRALGVFTGTLNGQTLRWRLSHHGLGPSASWARLRVAGRTVRLCAPCASLRTGSIALTTAETQRRPVGRRIRRSPRRPRGTVTGKVAFGAVPTLQVAVADGARLTLPATVHYTVTGYTVGTGAGQVVATGEGQPVARAQSGPAGTIVLPDDKRLTGRRDLTFTLVDANGAPLTNVEATVRVYSVRSPAGARRAGLTRPPSGGLRARPGTARRRARPYSPSRRR